MHEIFFEDETGWVTKPEYKFVMTCPGRDAGTKNTHSVNHSSMHERKNYLIKKNQLQKDSKTIFTKYYSILVRHLLDDIQEPVFFSV